MNTTEYLSIIENIKHEINAAQYRAAVHVNADMLLLYYDIGCVINEHKTWGSKFIDNLLLIFGWHFRKAKVTPSVILSIWQNLPKLMRKGNLCNRLLHKFLGGII